MLRLLLGLSMDSRLRGNDVHAPTLDGGGAIISGSTFRYNVALTLVIRPVL
jgi:hypothetical protein